MGRRNSAGSTVVPLEEPRIGLKIKFVFKTIKFKFFYATFAFFDKLKTYLINFIITIFGILKYLCQLTF